MNDYEKAFQIRIPKPLFEAFYRAFPRRGERKQILLEVIEILVEKSQSKHGYAEWIVGRLEERRREEE